MKIVLRGGRWDGLRIEVPEDFTVLRMPSDTKPSVSFDDPPPFDIPHYEYRREEQKNPWDLIAFRLSK